MHVIATAGHVDHGKSTLVRAVTGMEPDRFDEEKQRGLTIELGYVWTTLTVADVGPDLPEDPQLAFVDVPGHERFLGTMLAGLGPAPAVLFVVAADEGWCRQATEHLAAIDALGIEHGLLVVTRSDRADPGPATAAAQDRLAASSIGRLPAVAVSAITGHGLPELRTALARLVDRLPRPETRGRVRLWVDRSFSVPGAGTVITGTLGRGQLAVGDTLALDDRRVRIRGLQCLGEDRDRVPAVARVAVNLRGVDNSTLRRGDALLQPDAWPLTPVVDARCLGADPAELPRQLMAHLGTAAIGVRVRPLGGALVRLTLDRAVPCEPGDRLVLRDPGRRAVVAGAVVLDVDPPELHRRGAARQRAAELEELQSATPEQHLIAQVRRRGAIRNTELTRLGIDAGDPAGRSGRLVSPPTDGTPWLVDVDCWQRWQQLITDAVEQRARSHPLDPRLPIDAAGRAAGIPDRQLVHAAAAAAGLVITDGRVMPAETRTDLGAAESGLAELESLLQDAPYDAPQRPQLQAWGLGRAELAAAERVGRILRLADDVVLLPTGPAVAMRELAALPQPFTTSQARQALGSTRRVIIPLLEHLDQRGWTVRVDNSHRRVRTGPPGREPG